MEMVSRSVEDATDDEQVARSLTGCVVGLFVFQIMDHVERASGKRAARQRFRSLIIYALYYDESGGTFSLSAKVISGCASIYFPAACTHSVSSLVSCHAKHSHSLRHCSSNVIRVERASACVVCQRPDGHFVWVERRPAGLPSEESRWQ
jgi:hypothetical protein